MSEISAQVSFVTGFDQYAYQLHPDLGFWYNPKIVGEKTGTVRFMGFATPRNASGQINPADIVTPVTDLNDVPQHKRTVRDLQYGVGPKIHAQLNDLGTVLPYASAYTFDINPNEPELATRGGESTYSEALRLWQLKRQVGKQGLAAVLADVHQSYGAGALAVLINRPMPWLNGSPEDRTRFIIPLDPKIRLSRVGTVVAE